MKNKCAGCVFQGEYQDMGGSTPVCLRHTGLLEAIEASKSIEPCERFASLEDVTAMKPKRTTAESNHIRDIISNFFETAKKACDGVKKMTELAEEFRKKAERNNPCVDCIHDSVCGCRTHEDEICDEYAEICHCSECAYNYGLRNGLEFSEEDIVCSLWDSDGFTERDFCSQGKKLVSLSREELLEIMSFEEVEKLKAREGTKDGLSAYVTILKKKFNIKKKERKEE